MSTQGSTQAPPAAIGQSTAAQTASPGANAQPVPATTPQEIRKIKLKLDGKEVELPESEVIAYAQQGKSSTQRFQEASRMKQEAEQLMAFAKANPKEFFAKTGMNARDWAEKYLVEELQREAMSPEQRKAQETEDELGRYKREESERKQKEKLDVEKRLQKEHHDKYEQVFIQALNESGLPKTPFTIKRMAELQLINLKNKYEFSPGQLAKLVREDYLAEQKATIGGLDGDQLIDFLGPELVKKLSKAQIAKLKAKGNPVSKPVNQSQSNGESGLSWEDFQRMNRGKPPKK